MNPPVSSPPPIATHHASEPGTLRRGVKSLAGSLLATTGLHARVLGEKGIVVAFHRVSDEHRDSLTCSVKDFDAFCRFFRRHFTVIPLGEMVTRLDRGQSLAGTLAVTFDDGYRDNYEHAAPILRDLGLPAAFFVVSDFIGSDTVPWWDRECDPPPRWMTWDEVRELRASGFEIGAHTRTHADLGAVSGSRAEWEIAGARRELETRLGAEADLFAYPYGRAENMTEANRELVRQAGFRCCASCHGGINLRGGDAFRLCRVPISSWFATPGQFALEVALHRV